MSQQPKRRFVEDAKYATQPKMPTDRPATRAEVWAWVQHWFADLKDQADLQGFARGVWTWDYVRWFNFKGWRRQPNWKPGDPIIPEAVPDRPFQAGGDYGPEVYRLLAIANDRMKAAA